MAGETFQLIFRNNENITVSIDEPINFATVDFQLSQKDKGYGRDVSFNGGETQFEFVKYRNHYLDKLLIYNNTYGFESIVELIITCGTVTTIIGELDFATAVTDDLEYFKCKVIQQSSKQIVKRRKSVKVDLLSDKDVDGNAITPLVPENTLLISKPIYQVSKWKQAEDAARYYSTFSAGTRTWGINFSRQIIQGDIADTLVPVESKRIDLGSGEADLQCITALTNLKNIKISIPAFYFYVRLNGINVYNPDGYLTYSFNYGITDSPSDNFPTENRFINTVTLNTEGAVYTYNQSFEATIPSLSSGQSLFIWHEIKIRNQTDYNYVVASVTCKGMNVNISAESDTFNSVAPSFRLVDVMRQVVKSISGLNISAPRFEIGQDFYDNRLFNGNSLRAISDKPFYVSLEDLEKSLVELNVDWEINADGDIFFGIEDDFYTNNEVKVFPNTQFSSFNKSFNPRFSINEFNYGYKNFQSLKENEEPNSADVIHGESKWVLGNKMVENKKEISIEWTRDAFLIETNRRKALEISLDTSSQNDDTLFAIDTLNTTSDVTYSEKITLLHSYNSTTAILTLSSSGEINFVALGIKVGTSFSIISPTIYNIGTYTVVSCLNKTLQLISGSIPSGYTDAFLTYFSYTLNISTIPYTNYTNGGFTNISNLIASDKYSNLRYSTKRNIQRYWSKYLATCNLYKKEQAITNTWYKNNKNFTATYAGLTLTESDPITTGFIDVKPNLTPFMYNEVVFANIEFSDFIALQDSLRTIRGYIKTYDNNGLPILLYPMSMKYENLSKELTIKAEEKFNSILTPAVETKAIIKTSTTSTTSGGNILSDGYSSITAKGVVWSTISNPTIALSTKTNEGTGNNTFSSLISPLVQYENYYTRAYATNVKGTSYGQEINFLAGITDIQIGNQIWMLENLDIVKYRNGDTIPQSTTDADWISKGTNGIGAWCWYANSSANGLVYGKLYNWYAVKDSRGLAPLGYHVPSDAEFGVLTNYLGGDTVAGGKMKEAGIVHWQSDNSLATNESGFTALPGGFRNTNGTFFSITQENYLWSSSEYNTTNATVVLLGWYNSFAFKYADYKSFGMSVRLIKD
jgi:uncharacterized protein (TIGR02145 family)